MPRQSFRLAMLALLCAGQTLSPARLRAWQLSAPADSGRALEGKHTFATSCAACHGLDGRGGDRGPDISSRQEVQRLPDQELLRIVENGIAGTGMPSFGFLGSAQIQGVVRHLRSLQGQIPAEKLPGDAARGKEVFFGKGECSQCHAANGQGGFIASDLSRFAGLQSAAEIRSTITDPNTNLDPRRRSVVVTTKDGNTQRGIARNEDNFSLQMQAMDGSFHSFRKSELRKVEYQPRSLMPADYDSRLSRQELDDLVSYLMSLGRK